jgi:hypothetical protein
LRKKSRIWEIRWTINPKSSRISLIPLHPSRDRPTQTRRNLMNFSINLSHLLMLVRKSRNNKMRSRGRLWTWSKSKARTSKRSTQNSTRLTRSRRVSSSWSRG